jgi:hypothetical protein
VNAQDFVEEEIRKRKEARIVQLLRIALYAKDLKTQMKLMDEYREIRKDCPRRFQLAKREEAK